MLYSEIGSDLSVYHKPGTAEFSALFIQENSVKMLAG